MNKIKYQKMIEDITPKENRMLNMFTSFITGGFIGLIGNILFINLNNIYNQELSVSFTLLILIIISSLITALGFGDNLFAKLKCGLIIPITGFAHSVSSCIIDCKKEGLLNMGANAFKLAGSVILYGVVSSVILTLLKVIIYA